VNTFWPHARPSAIQSRTRRRLISPPTRGNGYHENYYGAFVRDPDGNNVEAVCHRPE